MAKLDPNNIIGILHGKVGDLIFARMRDGSVYVRRTPIREAPFRSGEIVNQSRFTQAAGYVKRIRQQPEEYGAYEAAERVKGKRACDLANADFRKSPRSRSRFVNVCAPRWQSRYRR